MDKYISQPQIRCFNIDSVHQFVSLRGRQKRTGSQQISLVWTSQSMICLKFWLSEMRLLRLSNTTNLNLDFKQSIELDVLKNKSDCPHHFVQLIDSLSIPLILAMENHRLD